MTEVKQAILASIEKWEKKAAGVDTDDIGPEDCPLCQLFFKFRCEGCPILAKTGSHFCYDTPYSAYVRILVKGTKDEIMEKAQEEVDFLKTLLE